MKKNILLLILLIISLLITSCKKGYKYLNAQILCNIQLKDPILAPGKIFRTGTAKRFSLIPNTIKNSIDFSNGFLYISDGYNNRVLKIDKNSSLSLMIYADKTLNTTFYDTPEQAPKVEIGANITKIQGEIYSPGVLVVDNEGSIYVETYKPGENFKPPFHYILKFDSKGELLFKVGQDGRDGLNFGANEVLTALYTDSSNNLYVISRYKIEEETKFQPYGIMIRVYGKDGKFLLKSRSHVLIPKIETSDNEFIIIEDMLPAPSIDSFIFSVAFYKDKNKLQNGEKVELVKKELYKINYTSNVIEKIRKFPENELSLLSITNSGNIYFNTADGNNLDLVITDIDGKVLKRNRINFFTGEGKYVASHVTSEGRIIGVFYNGIALNFYSWL